MQRSERDPARARAAHLLRRGTLVPHQPRIEQWADLDWSDGVARLIDEAKADGEAAEGERPADTEDWDDVIMWWLGRMARAESGLHERLAWFWHTLLTTSAEKVDSAELLSRQLMVMRENATGNYRHLLQGYVASGALLQFLDASWSEASNPNENLARELMELFTIGRGNYTQDDVRSAARALAGWVVEDDKVEWRRENAFIAPLLFRGVQDDWNTPKIVDHLCDQPETAANISARLWHHLVGTYLAADDAAKLGGWWQSVDLEILPLVERILMADEAETARLNKPRTGLEWFLAFQAATGAEMEGPWALENLGQMPYLPPNVGGWPNGDHWVSAGSLLGRLSTIANVDAEEASRGGAFTPGKILDRCGLHEVGRTTLDVLDAVGQQPDISPEGIRNTTWRLALSSPEFNLS